MNTNTNVQVAREGHVATCANCGETLYPSSGTGRVWVHGHSGGTFSCDLGAWGGPKALAFDVRPDLRGF